MKSQHTPTPWLSDGLLIRVVGGEIIAVIHEGDEDAKEITPIEMANSQFIVRAVNSHDELVIALQRAQKKLDTLATPDHELAQIIQAALSKAKGE